MLLSAIYSVVLRTLNSDGTWFRCRETGEEGGGGGGGGEEQYHVHQCVPPMRTPNSTTRTLTMAKGEICDSCSFEDGLHLQAVLPTSKVNQRNREGRATCIGRGRGRGRERGRERGEGGRVEWAVDANKDTRR